MRASWAVLLLFVAACGGQTATDCPPDQSMCALGCPGGPPPVPQCVKNGLCIPPPCAPPPEPDDGGCNPGETPCYECGTSQPFCTLEGNCRGPNGCTEPAAARDLPDAACPPGESLCPNCNGVACEPFSSGSCPAVGPCAFTEPSDASECPAGEMLCDVCGTVGCYASACPVIQCTVQVTGDAGDRDEAGPGNMQPPLCELGVACSLTEVCTQGVIDCGPNCQCLDGIWQMPCPASLPETDTSCSTEGVECGYVTTTNPCGAADCDCRSGAWSCDPTCTIAPIPDAGPEPSNEGSDAADAACPAGTFLCPMCPGPGTVCQDHECAGPMCPPVGP
jgi:hypothetical protein